VSYVAVRNLERYQHDKERRPPWVKLYVAMLNDEDFGTLSVPARLVFLLSLLLAADRNNRIPADPGWMAVEMRMPRSVIAKALAELLAGSYLIPASTVASNGAGESARPETETENRDRKSSTKPTRTTTDVGDGS
jgi:hypothetical protein